MRRELSTGIRALMSGAFGKSGAGSTWTDVQDDEVSDELVEVSPLVVDAVGKALKAHFQAIAELPLPDRLLVLLAELEARERDYDA
jgi:hypothetical protein